MNMPLFAKERTAAKLLDMTPQEFRDLVQAGSLPAPMKIGKNHERWSIEDIKAIMNGTAARPQEDFEL